VKAKTFVACHRISTWEQGASDLAATARTDAVDARTGDGAIPDGSLIQRTAR
jgi:hypothetical protein